MRDLGLVSFDEPFANLLTQGMVLNDIFQRKGEKGGITYYAPEEVEVQHDAGGKVIGARAKADGQPVDYAGIGTMSKSKRNGVDPQELIERYGADTARFFIIFTSPPEQTLEWNDAGVEGASRFLKRVWSLAYDLSPQVAAESKKRAGTYLAYAYPVEWRAKHPQLAAARREIHANVKQATYDIERQQFNTVASAAMKIYNALAAVPRAGDAAHGGPLLLHEGFSILLRVLYPIAPHIAHALWRELGYAGDPMVAAWPEADPAALETDEIELVLQVNGKLRGHLRAPKDADKAAIEGLAQAHESVVKHTEGRPPKKVIVVPGRLVNVVV
jgi:leucyl-tRNA synthetase